MKIKGFNVKVGGQTIGDRSDDNNDINRKEINFTLGKGKGNMSRLDHADARTNGGAQINVGTRGVEGKFNFGSGKAAGAHKEIEVGDLFRKKNK
jgi:hypothetical protein